jgi:FkbM family methyltransferase
MTKNRIFLDCGQFDGVAIRQYCVDDSWQIYSFEPEPQPKEHTQDLPPLNFIKKAVWTKNGWVNFSLDPKKQASHIVDVAGTDYENRKRVHTIDFSEFVSKLPKGLVVCSMDIEGAEFAVLRKMIKDKTIKRISVLDVEFHHRIMATEDDLTAKKLIQEISKLGVIVRLKIVLNK